MLSGLNELLVYAEKRGAAVGAFNCATLESARAAIEAAEELGVPVVLQHAQVHEKYMPLSLAGPVMIALAQNAAVPVAVHLDHGVDEEYVRRAVALGFTSVMFDCSNAPLEENLARTAEIVKYAHERGVSVEAELGHMPSGDEQQSPAAFYTDPAEAARFVSESGVDALAVSFGTAHGVYKTEPKLDFGVIEKVREATRGLPLVMHGGSGVSAVDFARAIDAGIRKINYYTYEALAGGLGAADAVREAPKELQFHDVAMRATAYMKDNVKEAMKVFYRL